MWVICTSSPQPRNSPKNAGAIQDDLDLAAIDQAAHQPERGEADARAARRGRIGGGGAVCAHAVADSDQPVPAGDAERPGFGVAAGEADYAVVVPELVGMPRAARAF